MRLLKKSGAEKPNLLVLCQLFYPELVSTGQTLTELCEELVRCGVDVKVVCAPPTILRKNSKIPKYIEHKGIKIRRVWGTRFPKLNLAGRIINQMTFTVSVFFYLLFDFSKRPILVLTNPPFLSVTCALLKSLRIGKPYIYLIFDVYPDTAIHLGVLKKNGFVSKVWDKLNSFVFKHSASIIVIGKCMKNVITNKMKTCGLKMEHKIHSIHVWSDDEAIGLAHDKPNPFLEKWNLNGKLVVGYFGNMGRFHDMETIMEAANILNINNTEKNILFLFVGEGHKKQYVMDYANKQNLKNCQFHSYVDRQDLGLALSSADIGFVSLAKGQEGLSVPSKTFAMMAAGLPVVAVMSPSSEIAGILLEEKCGLVTNPGDPKALADVILSFYNTRQKLELMGINARQAIDQKYNLHSAVRSYYHLIYNLNEIKEN